MPGGRPRGSLNKRSQEFREKYEAACKKYGCDLIDILVKFANDENLEVENRIRAAGLLTPYAYPKLKAQEVTVTDPVKLVIVDASQEPPDPLA